MHARLVLILCAAAFLAVSCGSGDEGGGTAATGGEEGNTATVELSTQNDSGESGTATLTAQGSKTKVVLALENPASDMPQPAHVHKGTCADLDPNPAYALTNVVDGASETTVDVPLEELEGGSFAINVHKSEPEAAVYVSCGNIGSGGGSGGDTTGGSSGGY